MQRACLMLCLAAACAGSSDRYRLRAAIPPAGPDFAAALEQAVGARMIGGNAVEVFDNGDVFDAMAEDVAKARTSIHVLIYIWHKGLASDRLVQAVAARASAGVACRVVVDAFGSLGFHDDVAGELERAGCEVREFRPLTAADKRSRNHRKLLVLDGRVAFTGGFGIRDEWLGHGKKTNEWRDTAVRFRGPVVADAQRAFAESWLEAGGQLLPRDAFPKLEPAGTSSAAFVSSSGGVVTRAERLSQFLIASARKRIWLANAYFVPSPMIQDALIQRVAAGVDVRILTAGKKSDSTPSFVFQQTEYGSLIQKGVKVWEYRPAMMHAKTMVIDDRLVLVGSINLDPLSLNTLEECALIVDDPRLAAQLAASFTGDCDEQSSAVAQ